MHELAISCAIVDPVVEASGRKVTRLTVEIGKLSGIVLKSVEPDEAV